MMLKVLQLIFIEIIALREIISALTDIGNYNKLVAFTLTIVSFPSKIQTGFLFDRHTNSIIFSKMVVTGFITFHIVSFFILTFGVTILIYHFNSNNSTYKNAQNICVNGLIFIIMFYIFTLGLMCNDFYLTSNQQPPISFNLDLLSFITPAFIALYCLNLNDAK